VIGAKPKREALACAWHHNLINLFVEIEIAF
jgi:hypothetical protein